MKKNLLVSILAIIASLVTSHAVQAQASVYEGFAYTNGLDITTISTTATGLGNWTSSTAGITGTTDSVGLTFGSLTTTGGALDVAKLNNGAWQFLAAPISAGGSIADGSTLYASYLFQYNGLGGAGTGDNFGLSVGNSTGADHTLSLLAQAYVSNPNVGRIGYQDGNFGALATGNGLFDGNTYMFIGKWTNLNGTSAATGWVLSLANFNAITGAGPVTEAALNSNNITSNTAAGTASSFGTSQFVKIGDYMDGNVQYKMDEVRFGSSLSSVAPVVPEPSVFAAIAVGGAALVMLRRRRIC